MKIKCLNCGKEIESNHGRKYCSNNCKEMYRVNKNRTDMICPICGKHFYGSPDKGQRFCSKACGVKGTPCVKILTCVDCGKQFEFYGRTRKLRCDECWHKHRSTMTMLRRAAKDPSVRIGIGSGGGQKPTSLDGDKALNSRKAAINAARRERYRSKGIEKIAHTYTYRDKIITGHDSCAICGYGGYQDAMVVHHKDMNRLNNEESNLVVLCANCHTALHKRLKRYLRRVKGDVENLWEVSLELLK